MLSPALIETEFDKSAPKVSVSEIVIDTDVDEPFLYSVKVLDFPVPGAVPKVIEKSLTVPAAGKFISTEAPN